MEKTSESLTVTSDTKNLAVIRTFVLAAANGCGLSEEEGSEMRLAVDEACANIMVHGYGHDGGELTISVDCDDNGLIVTLVDGAPPFDPLAVGGALDTGIPLESRPLGGMGIMLIKQSTDSTKYQALDGGGNMLVLTKRRGGAGHHASHQGGDPDPDGGG